MYKFPIGVLLDCFKTDIDIALEKAVSSGAKGVQIFATSGEMSPDNLKGQKKIDFLDKVRQKGLVITALCGDLGYGFGNAELNPNLIEHSKKILYLAKELETNIVTTHIGVVPDNPSHDRYKVMQEACFELSQYADSLDAHFAIETGPETAIILKSFLDTLKSRGVSVNLDPANLVMVTGDDPVQAVYTLKDYIVHTHAKDGIKLNDANPEAVYGIIESEIQHTELFKEVPLGHGSVDFQNYLRALDEIGYKGFLTIEREVGNDPEKDIKMAVNFLNNLINK